jgi:hypothetical protein
MFKTRLKCRENAARLCAKDMGNMQGMRETAWETRGDLLAFQHEFLHKN